MIKCIIIEDEPLARDVIQNHLQKTSGFTLVGAYRNAPDARLAMEKEEVDLLFLDIQLPGMTGLSFLRSLEHQPLVVFTTSYPEYALESYEFNVIDYLLKPISFERFAKTIQKIIDGKIFKISDPDRYSARDHIFIRANNKFNRIEFSDIVYIEGMKDYLKIHTRELTIITHQTLGEMENILQNGQFRRIHKSYIIALPHIKAILSNSVDMGKANIPIGLSYKDRITEFLNRKP